MLVAIAQTLILLSVPAFFGIVTLMIYKASKDLHNSQ